MSAVRPAPRGPRAPVVAYGLALVAVAVLVLLGVVADVAVDLSLVVPLLLLALGALLVVSALVTGLRRRR